MKRPKRNSVELFDYQTRKPRLSLFPILSFPLVFETFLRKGKRKKTIADEMVDVGIGFLSASLQLLFHRMASREFVDFVRRSKLDNLLNKLKMVLLSASELLNDAERTQFGSQSVRLWLDELKDAIYQTEDVVYELHSEALQCEMMGQAESGSGTGGIVSQVQGFFSSTSELLPDVVVKLRLSLKNNLDMLEFLVGKNDVVGLIKGVKASPFRRLSKTGLVDEEFYVFGRDADREAIVNLLLSDEEGGHRISVVVIVGMAGIGKTTLAQLVYMDIDKKVRKPFDIKAWITLSDELDVFRSAKKIYEKVTNSLDCCVGETFDKLQLKLKKCLEGKRILFVIDDVWNENPERWYALKSLFESASHGSKIIITTEYVTVGSRTGTVPNYYLETLSEEDSWQLFLKRAFNNVKPSAYKNLEEIGEQIVKKCRGFPLEVTSLAGLLRTELDPRKWKDVLKSEIWDLPQHVHFPALWLSYHYLPPHLKRCFAYCSIFPKGYKFQKHKLILLWMAEDLLVPQNNKTLEEVGEEYFHDLTSRSFFHKSKFYGFTMHELVSDLAQFVSGEYCLRLDDNYLKILPKKTHHFSWTIKEAHINKKLKDVLGEDYSKIHRKTTPPLTLRTRETHIKKLEDLSTEYCLRLYDECLKIYLKKTRHLSWMTNEAHKSKKLEDVPYNNSLRTLLRIDGQFGLNNKFLMHPNSLQNFQCLRVLSLYRVDAVTGLLDFIGKLKLLRYLDLSWTEIKDIPNTICSLYNLQTLLLHYCSNLSMLPGSIGKLKHLRYLDLSNTQVEEIPDAVCNLHDLHTLLLGSCRLISCLPTCMEELINLRHLDIRATSIREIPPQLSNLRYLKISSDFVVGTSSESGIKMLGELQNMCGNLSIKSLEKVLNVDDVLEANLKDEKCITDLSLEWKGNTDDSQKSWEVLNGLQPHINLEQISIINYGGISFSDWVGDHSFSRLVYMSLSKCRKCCHLPPLGQLPSLKSLSIDGFDMVERIGDEFYTCGSSTVTKPFKSLEKLSFKFMPRWKEWSFVDGEVFSQLKELHLMDCPSLTLNKACFPDSLPSLTCLYISKCQHQVVASLLSGQLPLLGSLYIGYCPELESFPERRLPINIHKIEIFGCQNLELFLEEGWPSNLKSLSVGGCGKLFVPHMQWNLQTLTSLTSLHFSCMDELVDSFPEEGQLPTTLTSLTLCHLHNLKSLNGKAFQQLTSLEELSISYCKQLKCMPKEGLPRTLTSLHLSCLDNLKSLNGKALVQLSSLEKLSISYCPQLPCMPEQRLPASLSQLTIEWCRFLNPRCQREIGDDWPMIAHIPCIRINPKLM
ncbi:putative disease resistance protein At3g14460 [Ziziphus jujuba]|uniref:Disease resistance protein At3g14460 n=1 Tax=Ziziphus jujuba TaxID=326968 RepID=A0ABM3IQP8_ZIZJJ|nr:putative disease resistance protein At3g14460 [Ziziphus jujuba]XP_024931618.2 putative disease resistance protein At3g14460 [Ziziphus jujuba]XP_048333536.1 putative disease resistance protein At3g14460 [Ziziphus jujuba]XP_048333538.1 putative disease resistance protein At3g14460 [Ziziphus jujuba]XP_048333539.1 putative disease resistance protein At3g14460 [Ziziphus jujuba]XP_048333540.1 putative disease resistance protein At3g14460 [Ziziphus jujuba]XP_048333541.1 putative disease resistanc